MGLPIAPETEYDRPFGKAMRALTDKQRLFVIGLLECGGNQTQAYARAGYKGDDASLRSASCRLAHDPKIRAAVFEEAQARMDASGILATSVLVEIAQDSMHRDRLKAALAILDRIGLHARTEHKITVTKEDDAEKIMQIRLLAEKLGMDGKKLLGAAGHTIDAEFSEVKEEDWAGV